MSVYLISDTHFDHENIIRYCDRPFGSLDEMESCIINNWNTKVSSSDTVLFGGDLAMAPAGKAATYIDRLNGSTVVLTGNHDSFSKWKSSFPVLESEYFQYEYYGEKFEFYYSHWPQGYSEENDRDDEREEPSYSNPPAWFNGWNIHGHVHNNDLENFPLVNPEEKRVNVASELLGYTPIHMNDLIKILKKDERYETVTDVPDEIHSVD